MHSIDISTSAMPLTMLTLEGTTTPAEKRSPQTCQCAPSRATPSLGKPPLSFEGRRRRPYRSRVHARLEPAAVNAAGERGREPHSFRRRSGCFVHRASRPAARENRPRVRLGGPEGDFARARANPASRPSSGIALLARGRPRRCKNRGVPLRAGRWFPETEATLARHRRCVKLFLAHRSDPAGRGPRGR